MNSVPTGSLVRDKASRPFISLSRSSCFIRPIRHEFQVAPCSQDHGASRVHTYELDDALAPECILQKQGLCPQEYGYNFKKNSVLHQLLERGAWRELGLAAGGDFHRTAGMCVTDQVKGATP